MVEDLNLCELLVKEMRKLHFKETSINRVMSHRDFVRVRLAPSPLQRVSISLLIVNDIFLNGKEVVPSEIRLRLTLGQSSYDWWSDMVRTVIPFMKENEDSLFN